MKRYGKRPARPGAVALKLGMYAAPSTLPKPPAAFGHYGLIKQTDWGMLGNDFHSDCIFAGAAHETKMFLGEAHRNTYFATANVLKDYAAVTGYRPGHPDTDQGGDIEEAAAYRRKTGVLDGHGVRHKIAAYVALSVGDTDQLASATYVFGACGVGFQMPSYAEDLFDSGKPLDVIGPSPGEDGHYIACVGRKANGNFVMVTWGRAVEVTPRFVQTFMDEGLAYLSEERLSDGKSLEGFDLAALRSDLDNIG